MAGSLEKRGENSWRMVYFKGRDQDGNRIRYTDNFKGNKSQAEKALAKFVTEIENGTFADSKNMTIAKFSEEWVETHVNKLAPKTQKEYIRMLDTHILPKLGNIKLADLRPTHLMKFYKYLDQDGIRLDKKPGKLSERSQRYYHAVLSSMLEDAMKWQYIVSNPATRVEAPKVHKKQTISYDEIQSAALLEALLVEPIKYRCLVTLALFTGLRRGELLGLEWKVIDMDKGQLAVVKQSQYTPETGIVDRTTKTESSKRLISIPPSIVALLKEYKAAQNEERLKVGDLWQKSDRLFTTWDGKPMHPDTVSSWFNDFLNRHNEKMLIEEKIPLPHIRFHDLRHTSASLMISQGVSLKNVSSRLGHSSITITADIYTTALQSADKEASNKLEDLFSIKKEQA
ncbi:MAG TPA: site-specific integrase [Desulfosporosinus sp.]|nr:site-specific integrase [Desulfosporosinus sp.]